MDTPPGLDDLSSPTRGEETKRSKAPLPMSPPPAVVGVLMRGGGVPTNTGEAQLAFWQRLQGQRDPMMPVPSSSTKTRRARLEPESTTVRNRRSHDIATAPGAENGSTASDARNTARIAELETRVQELRTTLWHANSRLGSLQSKYIDEASDFGGENDDLTAAEEETLRAMYDEHKTSSGGFPVEKLMPAVGRALGWDLGSAPGKLCRQFVINRLQWSGLPLSYHELTRVFLFVRTDPTETVELPHLRVEVAALREKLQHSTEEIVRLRNLVASESKARVGELATLLPQLQELAALRAEKQKRDAEISEQRAALDDARSDKLRMEHSTRAVEQMLLASQATVVKLEAELALAAKKLATEREDRSVEVMRKKHEDELESCRAGFASQFAVQKKQIASLMEQMQGLV